MAQMPYATTVETCATIIPHVIFNPTYQADKHAALCFHALQPCNCLRNLALAGCIQLYRALTAVPL